MQNGQKTFKDNNRIHLFWLCLGGLIINFLVAHLVKLLGLPLYLDNIGSALAAALGGYIPGIIVGFLTNLINGIGDVENVYYSAITILIAVASATFASKGYYDKPSRWIIIILVFAFFGGTIGSLLSFVLFGFSFAENIAAPFARALYSTGHFSHFWAQFTADQLVDLMDKTITVVAVATVLRLMPQALKDSFFYYGWQQAPLTAQSKPAPEDRCSRRTSLRVKIIALVALATLITGVAVTTISYVHFKNASVKEQSELAMGVVRVMQDTIDGDRVDDYLERGRSAPGYVETEAVIQHLRDSTANIEYCYVYRILEDGCHVVFDADTEDTPGLEPGEIEAFDEDFMDDLPILLAGGRIDPIVSHGSYGWLLTIYEPVYDSEGKTVCYAGVDISMNHITTNGYRFLARVISLFCSFFIMILTVGIWLAEYNIILPINTMARTTSQFSFDNSEERERSVNSITALDIRTGDEIENLYKSVVKTTQDMAHHTEWMEKQAETINKLQNGLILVLADMVESRDQCTGDHVRKTAAYTGIIMRQLRKEGIYTDQLTDTFMQDVENSAPLHDVGKIRISDTILNKPGKLTDEEFDLMKMHTVYGSEVIAQAMNTVSEADSSYLKEARNLAHYHHEKWNGKGYPCGLAGEDIPLSARIMAVADVFDALVSRRSYKEGFSFEKAMAIIREGSGTHFDPRVAEAFMHAGDEVRRVMNTYMGEGHPQ